MNEEKIYKLLQTTQDQNILWLFLLQNNYNFYISLNPNCSLEILKILSKSLYWYIREKVIYHQNCSLKILEQLSKHEDWYTRDQVAQSPNCSLEILDKLSKDKIECVRNTAQQKLNEKLRII